MAVKIVASFLLQESQAGLIPAQFGLKMKLFIAAERKPASL
ncbi:hypothetical protein [Methylophaga sp.]|jgi:hypothetical protein|nr:hypothetical protein [Methylophaga sp.]|tara:strand:+ start:373 stop:495 length:123 start_codon:yes stop_codon:yes gene_type:complete